MIKNDHKMIKNDHRMIKNDKKTKMIYTYKFVIVPTKKFGYKYSRIARRFLQQNREKPI